MENVFYPIVFEPVYKNYMWGGNRIALLFDRTPQEDRCAESWEIADRPEGMSHVANGSLRGQSLRHLVETLGTRLVGTGWNGVGHFPLLIKIIDARQRLSLQVHPTEKTASIVGGEPKTEMWYVLSGDENSCVYAGLKPGVDRAAFEHGIGANTLESLLEAVPAIPGKAIYVPGGLVHAIGEGCILLEVQQNSNTTYRVHDWGRLDRDGRPRETHLEQALKAIDWTNQSPQIPLPRRISSGEMNLAWNIIECPYFTVSKHEINDEEQFSHDGRTCSILFTLTGRIIVEANNFAESLTMGTTCLIPAGLEKFIVIPGVQKASLLRITLAG